MSRKRGQPFWKKSREALADYVAGKEVEVVEVDIDRYERVVGQVYLGDLWVNGALVRGDSGFTFVNFNFSFEPFEFD